jgi:CDP-glycerol glycerophosphotransferase
MTKKGFYKLLTKPHLFIRDYAKKNRDLKEKIKIYVEKIIDKNIPFPQYYYLLYLVFNKAEFFYMAEKALKRAIALKAKPIYYYNLGVLLKRKGQWWQIVEAFDKAIKIKPTADMEWHLAYAEALEKMNRFEEASTVLEKFAKDEKLDSNWYFIYGNLLKKISKEEESNIAFSKAIELDVDKNSKELGIGIFYELQGKWIDACEAYKEQVKKEPKNALIHYKLGLSYDRCYDWVNAEIEYMKAITLETYNAHWFYRLGLIREKQKKWELSTKAYICALERQENFIASWFYRLGYVLDKQKRYSEASKIFKEQRVLQDAHGVPENQYYNNASLKRSINYTEYYERYSLDDNIILYESYHGGSISGNPLALFRFLYRDERFKNYKHIWIINEKKKIPENLKKDVNIIFIKRDCDLYMRYLAKAKYLINNVTFPEYFIRKEGQLYLNTWHGTPIKTLGKDIKDDFFAHKNASRNFLQASHMISPNSHTTNILLKNFDIYETYQGIFAEIGYPRQDLTLNLPVENKTEIRKLLGILEDKKVVLYAPTWRGTLSGAKFDTDKLLSDIHLLKEIDNIYFLFRGHHMVETILSEIDEIKSIVVPAKIDTNSLLSIVDILITDYSSIAFDYMAREKPIIYYAYDRKEYETERGLYFPLEELGENIAYNNKQLIEILSKSIAFSKISSIQKKAQLQFCPYDDGFATRRVVELFFFDKKEGVKIINFPKKQSVLLYGGGFIPNGVTTSFLNLIEHIDKKKYSVSIVIDPKVIDSDKKKREQFNRLGKEIKVIGKFSSMGMTLEEKWIIDKFNTQRVLPSEEMKIIFQYVYQREFLRVFGRTKFDIIINFEGYNSYWVRLFSANKSANKIIYLHADMLEEAKIRFPYLYGNFYSYSFYNKLISVSNDANSINREHLVSNCNIDIEKFDYCDNLLNPQEILQKANNKIETALEKQIFEDSIVFINIARLSPEKDQKKLIRAFFRINQKYSKSKLIIIGQGELKSELQHLINDLKLSKKVYLLGQKFNPMPYLNKSDCFVLSSNYEGQGLVLLEAMILNKPVISTDIPGPRGVLKGNLGYLVENSEDGLYQGMLNFLKNKDNKREKFDYEKYNNNALKMFYMKVIGEIK